MGHATCWWNLRSIFFRFALFKSPAMVDVQLRWAVCSLSLALSIVHSAILVLALGGMYIATIGCYDLTVMHCVKFLSLKEPPSYISDSLALRLQWSPNRLTKQTQQSGHCAIIAQLFGKYWPFSRTCTSLTFWLFDSCFNCTLIPDLCIPFTVKSTPPSLWLEL